MDYYQYPGQDFSVVRAAREVNKAIIASYTAMPRYVIDEYGPLAGCLWFAYDWDVASIVCAGQGRRWPGMGDDGRAWKWNAKVLIPAGKLAARFYDTNGVRLLTLLATDKAQEVGVGNFLNSVPIVEVFRYSDAEYWALLAEALYIPANGGQWGSWQQMARCPPGTFVSGMYTRVEGDCGFSCDDSGLNSVSMRCGSNKVEIKPHNGHFGGWADSGDCPVGEYFVAVRAKVEDDQGTYGGAAYPNDDTALNAVDAMCSGGKVLNTVNASPFGTWGGWVACPPNSAVCGLNIKMEKRLGEGIAGGDDDTAANNVSVAHTGCGGRIVGLLVPPTCEGTKRHSTAQPCTAETLHDPHLATPTCGAYCRLPYLAAPFKHQYWSGALLVRALLELFQFAQVAYHNTEQHHLQC